MDKQAFEKFYREQYQNSLLSFKRRALHHQRFNKRLQLALFVFSGLSTFLIGLQAFVDWNLMKILAFIFSFMASSSAGIYTFFNPQERLAFYNNLASSLEFEHALYIAGGKDYSQASDKESLFVTKVSEILRRASEKNPTRTK